MHAHTPKCVGPVNGVMGQPQNDRLYAQACESLKRLEEGILSTQPGFSGKIGVEISYANGVARTYKNNATLDGAGGT